MTSGDPPGWLPDLPAVKPKVEGVDLIRYLHSDHGNSERFMAFRGRGLRYCSAMNKFLVWNGCYWAVDVVDGARQAFKETILEYLGQAVGVHSDAAEKFAKASLDSRRITNAMREAQHGLSILPEALDCDP